MQTGLITFNTKFYTSNDKYRRDNTITTVIPVESKLNLDLAYGTTVRTGVKYEFDGLNTRAFRQETNK